MVVDAFPGVVAVRCGLYGSVGDIGEVNGAILNYIYKKSGYN